MDSAVLFLCFAAAYVAFMFFAFVLARFLFPKIESTDSPEREAILAKRLRRKTVARASR